MSPLRKKKPQCGAAGFGVFLPNRRLILNIRAWGNMTRQGMAQLFFESAEPTLDVLEPDDFFARFAGDVYNL
ncbi:MAG: hypothetical protein H6968_03315 [Chromatiaceae bacterium]|nr:hypothetical protein [Chromatiaceae bacterium]MCP5442046.1 hypothetical protein [Chromatiaceae bacterium]